MWQEIIVGVCVLAAAVFLLRRWLGQMSSKNAGSCGSCGGCDSAKSCSNPAEKGMH